MNGCYQIEMTLIADKQFYYENGYVVVRWLFVEQNAESTINIISNGLVGFGQPKQSAGRPGRWLPGKTQIAKREKHAGFH